MVSASSEAGRHLPLRTRIIQSTFGAAASPNPCKLASQREGAAEQQLRAGASKGAPPPRSGAPLTLLVLDLGLDVLDGVRRLHLERDGLACEGQRGRGQGRVSGAGKRLARAGAPRAAPAGRRRRADALIGKPLKPRALTSQRLDEDLHGAGSGGVGGPLRGAGGGGEGESWARPRWDLLAPQRAPGLAWRPSWWTGDTAEEGAEGRKCREAGLKFTQNPHWRIWPSPGRWRARAGPGPPPGPRRAAGGARRGLAG